MDYWAVGGMPVEQLCVPLLSSDENKSSETMDVCVGRMRGVEGLARASVMLRCRTVVVLLTKSLRLPGVGRLVERRKAIDRIDDLVDAVEIL